MAMNTNTLKGALLNRFKAIWGQRPPADQARNQYWFMEQLAAAIAEEVVNHIKNNAKCQGTDVPQGNTHDNVGII